MIRNKNIAELKSISSHNCINNPIPTIQIVYMQIPCPKPIFITVAFTLSHFLYKRQHNKIPPRTVPTKAKHITAIAIAPAKQTPIYSNSLRLSIYFDVKNFLNIGVIINKANEPYIAILSIAIDNTTKGLLGRKCPYSGATITIPKINE